MPVLPHTIIQSIHDKGNFKKEQKYIYNRKSTHIKGENCTYKFTSFVEFFFFCHKDFVIKNILRSIPSSYLHIGKASVTKYLQKYVQIKTTC